MADIVPSLFGIDPSQIQAQQDAQAQNEAYKIAQLDPSRALLTYGMMNGARNVGNAINSTFGLKTDSQLHMEQTNAALKDIQDNMSPEDLADPTKMLTAIVQHPNIPPDVKQHAYDQLQKARLDDAKIANENAQASNWANKTKTDKAKDNFVTTDKGIYDIANKVWLNNPEGIKAKDIDTSDKLMTEAIKIANDPKATPEQLAWANKVYKDILPMKQPAQISQPSPVVVKSEDGTTTLVNPVTLKEDKLGVKGTPSAAYSKVQGAFKKGLADTTFAIDQLDTIIKSGDLEKATGSGVGKVMDNIAGFFGGTTEGMAALSRLAPAFDIILKQVPRFEGPQSDADVASYKQAAGRLADPTSTKVQKVEAATKILQIMKDRKGQFINQADAGTENDPLYSEAKVKPTTLAKKDPVAPSKEYTRFKTRWAELGASKDFAKQKALTDAARAAGIIL